MKELQFFEHKEIVYRKKFDDTPIRVEYSLAPLGRSLLPVINQIVEWGYTHLQDAKVTWDMYQTPVSL
jgi:DNA-binding HxlR family transcriptional regulator